MFFILIFSAVLQACLDIRDRPAVSALHDDYRLCSRLDTMQRPHHMIARNGAKLEARLRQTSLYRPELDLLVLDQADFAAAYGLFWLDPMTVTALVEPMRTENAHQQSGLARHLLTTGISLLAAAGAARVKLCFKPTNAAVRELYLSVGFKPCKQTSIFSRSWLVGAG